MVLGWQDELQPSSTFMWLPASKPNCLSAWALCCETMESLSSRPKRGHFATQSLFLVVRCLYIHHSVDYSSLLFRVVRWSRTETRESRDSPTNIHGTILAWVHKIVRWVTQWVKPSLGLQRSTRPNHSSTYNCLTQLNLAIGYGSSKLPYMLLFDSRLKFNVTHS